MNTKEKIQKIFETAETQGEALTEIYKMYFPNWDNINKIHNWPTCGLEMWNFICRCFQKLDKEKHPHVLAGGIWMNNGFSCNRQLEPWEVDLTTCEVS